MTQLTSTGGAKLSDDQRRLAACRHLPVDWWFPTRQPGAANHARLGKSICAACPIREACLVTALRNNEEHGVHGGAGEARRRVLRKAMLADPETFTAAMGAHWRAVDGVPERGDRALLTANGQGATHGRRSSFARGCRCEPCSLAASADGAVAKIRARRVESA